MCSGLRSERKRLEPLVARRDGGARVEGRRRAGYAAPVPPAARFADALRTATEQGAKAVRERRPPSWDAVHEALRAWDAEEAVGGDGVSEAVVRRGAGLVLKSLGDLTESLDTAASPMTLDGSVETSGRVRKP
ncbi:hypothetical protein ACFOZ0_11195 [Streptomyces yaanensis]|uniref:Uncharacterized protein n=1 Tax=Streptomyces yaanensis TaxID=1142239 RepID=A0ABV7SAD9_9ACTN|nr:hypothetical protein [Streptomyces sp. CGMCC 4.7035]WNB96900.1 hypothetical protein Q2K21_01775 [Streptomyces sp. CGMCC 4.7035]